VAQQERFKGRFESGWQEQGRKMTKERNIMVRADVDMNICAK
jgi:hypothetical protein